MGAERAVGCPNLLEDIGYTVRNGIRNEPNPCTCWSQMPVFLELFEEEENAATVE
ncbi:hypothetical protein [uncultured Tateyamaria sp.]|uniref:hypothetical protein n=1 Tax=uncultured Tateyamaria sp. TaxID=455651 RepID=UPI0026363EE5|nr:hypothetical protein [uncultured Tateyamaria sp.]